MGRSLLSRDRKQNTCISGERMLQGEETEAEPGRSKYQQRGRCGANRCLEAEYQEVRCIIMILDTCGRFHKVTENLMREYL